MKKMPTCYAVAACALLGAGTAPLAAAHDEFFVGTLSEQTEAVHLPTPSKGTGTTLVTLNEDDFTLRVEVIFFGLTGETSAAHIHCCTAMPLSGFAGVATQVPAFDGFPLGVHFGSYDRTFDMTDPASWNPAFVSANGGTTGSAFSALATGIKLGEAYLNLHTSAASGGVPGGEIRTFLLAPVPEPETYALMLAGLGLVGWAASRRGKVGV
jgi:hypothetical protein